MSQQRSLKLWYRLTSKKWDSNSLWESRYIWLPMEIDDKKKALDVVWHDIYDLEVKTGKIKEVKGKPYSAKDAKVHGKAWKQEAVSTTCGFGGDSC